MGSEVAWEAVAVMGSWAVVCFSMAADMAAGYSGFDARGVRLDSVEIGVVKRLGCLSTKAKLWYRDNYPDDGK